MAFTPIDLNKIKVGDPITKDILDSIKYNFDDHEFRINSLSVSGGNVFIFNGDVSFVNYSSLRPNIFYYTARQDFSLNDFRVRLFTKEGVTSGNLTIDLQKSVDPNDSNFNSVLTAPISFDFSSVSDYAEVVSTLNSALNELTTGDILRVKVLAVPNNFIGSVLLSIGAQ
jgi:hypothetical protein